jgi:alpha-methylacyl-CoA racemase
MVNSIVCTGRSVTSPSVLPLQDIRVADLSRLLPGGYCSLMLADLGADVIKVEEVNRGDYLRWTSRSLAGAEPSVASAAFVALNRNKRSIAVDLKHERGREAMTRLATKVDVLLESFRPGVMDRLGVGYRALRAANPRLVYCAITGHGQSGPNANRSGHDLNFLGSTGVLALSGDRDAAPGQPPVQVADLGSALTAAVAILAAVRERDRSGEGQLVDISMSDCLLSWLGTAVAEALASGDSPRRGDLRLAGGLVCYRPYPCKDGWVTLGALEPKFWEAWCRGVDRVDLIPFQNEPPGSPAHDEVRAILAGRTRSEWQAFGAEHDCCIDAVNELDEALRSPGVTARGIIVEGQQPGVARPVRQVGPPFRLQRTPADANRNPAPILGEQTREVLHELGYSDTEVDELADNGVVRLG